MMRTTCGTSEISCHNPGVPTWIAAAAAPPLLDGRYYHHAVAGLLERCNRPRMPPL